MLGLRRTRKMHSIVLVGGIIFFLVLMIQVKQIYDNNQKHYRFMEYKQYIKEIAAEMNVVERSANKSSAYVRQLNEALLKHREREDSIEIVYSMITNDDSIENWTIKITIK